MMKLRPICLFLLVSFASVAQTGNYFLSHFSPGGKQADNVCFDIAQDERGVFYFATQAGVLQFDGRNWDNIRTNGTAYAIEFSEQGELYVAGSSGFGKIAVNENGLEVFTPLYDKPDAAYAFQLVIDKDIVYFLNDTQVFAHHTTNGSTTPVTTSAAIGNFSSLTKIFGSVYIGTEETGFYKPENGALVKSKLVLPDSTSLMFATGLEKNYLLGTSDSRLFTCSENLRLKEIVLKDAAYASASVVISATRLNNELVALGTLRGGVMFINPVTGATVEIINYNTGLPDNEVFAIISDKNHNVWAAHTYGFTRIAPYLPLRSFSYYPGLQGNLLCATTFNGSVYVGTSLGLYKLEREEYYDEIVYYVNVPIRTKTQSKKNEPVTEVKEDKPEKGGFFKFLRKKKAEPETSTTTSKKSSRNTVQYRKEKRTKRILRSTYYGYKKVSGIDAKVTQLIQWRSKLLTAGLDGVFEVMQTTATSIIETPVRFLFASENQGMLLASSYDDKLHWLTPGKAGWADEYKVRAVDNPVNFIFEEDKALWLCSFDRVYRVEPVGDTIQNLQRFDLVNPNFDKTVGISANDEVVIATTSGFFIYNKGNQKLLRLDTLSSPKSFFASNNVIWFRDEHQWFLTGDSRHQENLQLLNLFTNIRSISTDPGTGNVWIINGNNELFRFYGEKLKPIETVYPIFLKSIGQRPFEVRKNVLKVDQENSSIKIEVVKPDYIGANAVEYRYFLQGLNETWSEWSNNNNTFDFPYLPPGKYTLQSQSKDIFGNISDMNPVTVEVLPPYWKRTWFYALEFAVFGFLVLLSFRLSKRYNFISRLLSLLSIIILIEFIQTAAGSTFTTNSGPVIEFLIQVFVAFIILPVEGFLRNFMLRSIEQKKRAS